MLRTTLAVVACALWRAEAGCRCGEEKKSLKTFKPSETAVVLIEFQNDFCSEKGAFHDGVKAVMKSTDMLRNSARVAKEARRAGCRIIHAPIYVPECGKGNAQPTLGVLGVCNKMKAFTPGSWC